jgi:hypothetical protein
MRNDLATTALHNYTYHSFFATASIPFSIKELRLAKTSSLCDLLIRTVPAAMPMGIFRDLQLDHICKVVLFPKMLYIGVIHPTPTAELANELPPGYPLTLKQLTGVLGLLPGRPITVEVCGQLYI